MREAIPPPLKRSPSLYTREAYFIRNNPQRNAVQNKRRLNIAVFSYTSQDREPSPVFPIQEFVFCLLFENIKSLIM